MGVLTLRPGVPGHLVHAAALTVENMGCVNRNYLSDGTPNRIDPFAVEGRKVAKENREGTNGDDSHLCL